MKRLIVILLAMLMLAGCRAEGTPNADEWERLVNYNAYKPGSTTLAEYGEGYAYIGLELPEGWEYALAEPEAPATSFGIRFWPEGYENEPVSLNCYPGGFAVCGTGLRTRDITMENGQKLCIGIYDSDPAFSYISYYGLPGDYAAWMEGACSWWDEYKDAAMYILTHARLGGDVISEAEAIEVAKAACTLDYNTTAARFDRETGQWQITFMQQVGGSGSQTVLLDAQGNLLKAE